MNPPGPPEFSGTGREMLSTVTFMRFFSVATGALDLVEFIQEAAEPDPKRLSNRQVAACGNAAGQGHRGRRVRYFIDSGRKRRQ
ncbi:hypothetical protein NL676_017214 [Syzygium grande]|nr:hypothetical protein NL676_017214 [Syzygium grande]